MPLMASPSLPLFERVTDCGALVVVTSCAANVRLAGLRLTCGWVPLSVTDSVPDWLPVRVGEKLTSMEQLAPTASDEPGVGQLLFWLKSPLVLMLLMVSGMLPLLVRVARCAELVVPTSWLPKPSEPGLKLAYGFGATVPVPLSAAVCGLPAALSLTARLPVRPPVTVGAKLTLIVQLVPASRTAPQLLV